MISAKQSIFSQLEDVVLEHSIDPDGPGRWVIPDQKWTEALRSIKGDAYHVSSPQVATHNGVNVQIESVTQHSSGLKREDDGSLSPCMNWSGWKTHLLPFVKDDGSIWVGVWIEQGTITDTRWPTDKEVVQRGVTKPVSIHSYEVLNFAATLKDDQIVVLPGLGTTADTDSEEWPLLTLRIRRLSDKPDPNSLPSPRRVSQTEPQSNEGVIGEIELASGVKQASRSRTERKSYRVTNFLTQRSLGTSTLTLRSQNDGLRMAVKLKNADTKEVLAGTAEDVRVHSKPDSSIVEMQNAEFRIFSDPGQRLIADKLMILSGSDSQLHQKLQLELQGAEIQLRTSGRRSQIKAESVNLKLNAATLSIEQLNASGLDSLKADPERISIASVYPVPDLVVPTIESFVVNVTGVGLTGVTPQWKSIEASGQPSNDRVAELIELISETIEPDSWQDNGGPGIVAFNESSLSLVVRQTQEVHEQIVDLPGQLRRLQDLDVALQMHTRVVDQGFLEKTGVDVTFEENGDSSSPKFAKLSRSDVEALRAESMWMPLPKITLLNGQGCHVILPDHADQRVSLWPAVSADRRFVRMSLATGQNRDTSPKPTLTLNDGGAFLVSLPRKSSEQQYLVIVKSDVHFVEEEEELLGIEAGPGGDP